jgi:hypothetical protein
MPEYLRPSRAWRKRAEQARTIAEQLSDPESKRTMLRIAAHDGPNRLSCGREGNRNHRRAADGAHGRRQCCVAPKGKPRRA